MACACASELPLPPGCGCTFIEEKSSSLSAATVAALAPLTRRSRSRFLSPPRGEVRRRFISSRNSENFERNV